MQLGMIGLGKMGGFMAERLRLGGHQVVGFDFNADAVKKLSDSGNVGVSSLEDMAQELQGRRRALDIVGGPPERVLFIDDREENAAAARATGMKAIKFEGAGSLSRELSTLGVT